MRPSIPKPSAVDAAFKVLAKRLDAAQKRVNAEAARHLKAGQYETAEKWMEIGRSVSGFVDRVAAFSQEWRHLVRALRIVGKAQKKQGKSSGAE